MWLNLKTSKPICSIENFDVFTLNKTASPTIYRNNNTIRYDLKLNNKENKDKGIYYDALSLKFYYKPNSSVVPLGNVTVPSFYQGHGKKTHRIGTIDARGVKWENATATRAAFKVELNTSVRYKIVFWKTKRQRLDLVANLEVDEQGSLVKGKKKKGIKFTSGAGDCKACNFQLLGILGILIFILSC